MVQFILLRCLSQPASARGLIYLSHEGDIFRLYVLERVNCKAGRAKNDPDSRSVEDWGHEGGCQTHQLTSHCYTTNDF